MVGGSPIVTQLREIQRAHGYIPVAALRDLSERTGEHLYKLHGVISFFPHFRLQPPPPVEVLVCDDLACHRRGSAALLAAAQDRASTAGSSMVVRSVSCLGRCDRAPACAINESYVSRLTLESLGEHLTNAAAGERVPGEHVTRGQATLAVDPYGSGPRYGAARALATSGDVAGVIAALRAADLRGMGGAGFRTGLKWELVRKEPGDEKYIVCNADESEPCTFKDRFLLEHVPHLLVEGMLLAGLVTGARLGIVYIRHEYESQLEIIEHEIAAARAAGALGSNVFGSGRTFELETFVSPGGYICGEESALLEALEGKRGEPRNKPPFPVTQGLHNKPTVINNVETFSLVPVLLAKGPEWFKAQGKSGASGLKFVGISGDVVRPGVYEIGMGTPAREVIHDKAGGIRGGRPLKGWAPSGPSSGFLPPSLLDTPLDFDSLGKVGSMLGSGAMLALSDEACMLDMALNAVRFFRNESCGKCVPCRVGSAKMVEVLGEIARGHGKPEHLTMIDDLSHALMQTSICGLGQVVPMPIRSVLTHFRGEVDEHLLRKRCPARVCPMVGA
ncbi:MAG TPA: NADH-ubiquinone oxidoreductase-F iron-sulfur binding region domain-containing protein [Methylomirabilota bacterium]|jgi:NADH:ubiquinone oxidoreductase subunit F (NADH-binding)/NADH:ubiquinone oxidoreductase subunit E|nr:NADH-ubiquinone oxidoreductase-F iron-sulfur binding region domain-containing protein [Methylomirabilota bacterium]